MNSQFWWFVARSTGLVAWALATAAVLWGLFLHTRALGKNPAAPWLLDLHRHLGALTVVFTGIHMGALVADSYVDFDLTDLLLPMASDWKRGAVAWGVLAFWGLAVVEVSSLSMKRIPKRVWRGIHLSSYLVFVLATAHGVLAGTDAGNPAVQLGGIAGVAALTFFLVYRFLVPKRTASRRTARPAAGTDRASTASDRVAVLAAARAARAERAEQAAG
jgi:DMSO/TMAO reductase YedYZ heme-binding membrane subunit